MCRLSPGRFGSLAALLVLAVTMPAQGHGNLKWALENAPAPTTDEPGVTLPGPLPGASLHELPLLSPEDPDREDRLDASYTLFESGQVRPIALSPDGSTLFVTNTPDARLEIFHVDAQGLSLRASIAVGLEPVAVAARSDDEVWVVNHLSDSVSIVRGDPEWRAPRLVRTLLVGDEPRDIVFAGPGRAFVTTAHRGQNSPVDPALTTPGTGRADVWVFDADDPGAAPGGTPETIVTLFTDTPRALAKSPDGSKVYAAGFHTGNRTATIFELYVPDGGEQAGGIPGPRTNHQGFPAPETGMILRWDGGHWRDEIGRVWDDSMRFTLPDTDLFAIDANANPPVALPGEAYAGIGTILFDIAVNPVTGVLYVSNTEANNMERFEGPGTFAGHSLRGHLHESRITVVRDGAVEPRHLNKHIDYSQCCAPLPNAENERSLAFPLGMAVTADGQTLYVAALGSSKIGVFATAALENDTFVADVARQIEVSGGGPTGLVLDEPRGRLYVLTRFDNAVAIVDTTLGTEIGKVVLWSPEPAHVRNGRRFLYDARHTSSHGDSACASCHVFGDLDSLAWDLGDPDADVELDLNPMITMAAASTIPAPIVPAFHPMKGPMTTQSLRGMDNHGPMHWRGDRTGSLDEPSAQPASGAFNEDLAFKKFNAAFPGLIGRDAMLTDDEMQAFTDFILDVTYPPNPIRNLDNSLTPAQASGKKIFSEQISTGGNTCEQCHRLDPTANTGFTDAPGFFGTSGFASFDFEPQILKVAHLRNLYTKVGRFGQGPHPIIVHQDHDHMGPQIRGFGYTHDGGFDTIFRFESLVVLQFPKGNQSRRDLEEFFLAFDSNLAPIVGQQITLAPGGAVAVAGRIDLLLARADAGECDLVVRGRSAGGSEAGWLYEGSGSFATDRAASPPVTDAELRQLAASGGEPLTYTCVPRGSGERMALDRDLDGALDGDERAAGTDPADPGSHP